MEMPKIQKREGKNFVAGCEQVGTLQCREDNTFKNRCTAISQIIRGLRANFVLVLENATPGIEDEGRGRGREREPSFWLRLRRAVSLRQKFRTDYSAPILLTVTPTSAGRANGTGQLQKHGQT